MAKLGHCKTCYKPMASDADRCPHCGSRAGAELPPEPVGKPCPTCAGTGKKHELGKGYQPWQWHGMGPCPDCMGTGRI